MATSLRTQFAFCTLAAFIIFFSFYGLNYRYQVTNIGFTSKGEQCAWFKLSRLKVMFLDIPDFSRYEPLASLSNEEFPIRTLSWKIMNL